MSHKPELPVEVADRIFQEGQNMLAFAPDNKWSYIQGATAYATQLHQLQQENESLTNQLKKYSNVSNENMKLLRQENEELRRQNDKLKEQATGWRPLLEDVLRDNRNGYIDIDEALCSRIKKFLYGEE